MRPPIEFLFPPELGAEIIYSFIIILCSLMVFVSTKEIYKLSSHKGLKYFRLAFLFFAIAYFFRYFTIFLLQFFNLMPMISLSPRETFSTSLFLFMYFSIMAIFYLLHSVMWKRWNTNSKIILFNIASLIIALFGTMFRGIIGSLMLGVILFIFTSIILVIANKNSKQKFGVNNLMAVYLLLFIFFFINIINILIPEFLQMYKILIYLISTFLFMAILYKVLRNLGN